MQRAITLLCIALITIQLGGCSWSIRFYIANDSAMPRRVELTFSKERDGFLIFDPRYFAFFAWRDGTPILEQSERIPQTWRENLSLEIPPHSALEIGHLNNDHYKNSRQKFINDRIFNLRRLLVGNVEVTRDTFDAYFKKTSAGYVWLLPE